jgi:pimeloyl-ACP methyl ester carboxylesterase
MVDIGSRRMHILAAGSGSPVVVIIPALGDSVLGWVRVQRVAAAETTVCVYDRAGLGFSDPPRGRVTMNSMARDLHALLKAAGVEPPYVIAGHSMGGIVARRLAAFYPGETAGMLLIDSSHEEQAWRPAWQEGTWPLLKRSAGDRTRILGVRRIAANLGLVDGLDAASLGLRTVPEYTAALRAIYLSSRNRNADVREMLLMAWPQGRPQSLGRLPLTVITAASPQRQSWPRFPSWLEMQNELAALSADTVRVMAANADHFVHQDDPELVVQEIRALVRRCRAD